jgi:hypoxanthine phosphoribosyltransferase
MTTTQETLEYAKQLLKKPMSTAQSKTKLIRYDLEVPEEFHWKLVALGANQKLHHEEYAERVLQEFAIKATQKINNDYKQSIINQLDRQTKSSSNGGQS